MRWGLVAGLALLAGCMSQGGEDPGSEAPSGDAAPTERMVAEESLTLDLSFPLYTQVCEEDGSGTVPVFVGGGTEKRLHLVENQTRLVVDFEWQPVNPTAARLHFSIVPSEGPGVAIRGESPLHLEVLGGELASLGKLPHVYVRPACDLPVLVASNPENRVEVRAQHFALA